ncbi:MAG TPA: hypothetical protein VFX25_01825 [Streptosporangiaceae bacterium]|nr:hypothetical protein [Streptosporangiaceae bacterium]
MCISRLVGELGAERGEAGGLIGVGRVAVGARPVAVEVVRLVEFPDLVPEGVLDGVAALLAQSVGRGPPAEDDPRRLPGLVLADEVWGREAKSAGLRARAAGPDAGMRLDAWYESAEIRYDRQPWNALTSLRFRRRAAAP